MIQYTQKLDRILLEYGLLLKQIPTEAYYAKPNPQKWSKIEILGHLVDSAQNNIRRFIVGQYEDNPYIVYEQDHWVAMNGYQAWSPDEVIGLWERLNRQVIRILSRIPDKEGQRTCTTDDPTPRSIEWLAADYLRHLLHHLHQVLEKEPVIYP
jgi:hypothetical protein